MYIFIAQKNETNYQGKNIFPHLTVRENTICSISLLIRHITTLIFDKVNEHNYKQLEINWN